jgi:hypothetical protein
VNVPANAGRTASRWDRGMMKRTHKHYCLLLVCLLGASCASVESQTNEAADLKRQNDSLYQEGLVKGKAEARADILANRVKYYQGGITLPTDALQKQILKQKYSVELVGMGCAMAPPIAGLVVGYNSVSSAHLEKKHGQDVIAASRAEAKARQQGTERAERPNQ